MSDQFESIEVLARTVARRLAPACRSLTESEFRDLVARVVSLVVAFRDDRPAIAPPRGDAPPPAP